MKNLALALLLLSTVLASSAPAAPTPEAKCQAAKNRAAGDYARCRQSAEAKLALTGDTAKYDAAIVRCESAVADQFAKAESGAAKKEAACATTGDAAGIEAMVASHADAVAGALAPGGAVPTCGDGTINVIGEQCDLADLGGTTCVTLGYSDGELACDGTCRFDAAACEVCSEDGGVLVDGTCWFLAENPQVTCDAVCGSKGRTCNETQTRDQAGSGGTLAACQTLVDLLVPQGAINPGIEENLDSCESPDLGVGCGFFSEGALVSRVVSPVTTCAANGASEFCGSQLQRVCACD